MYLVFYLYLYQTFSYDLVKKKFIKLLTSIFTGKYSGCF